MSRRSNQFSSVRTEGGLLPQDLLSRIQSGDKSLTGLTPESYHLGPHERVGEAVNRAWSRLTAAWHAFEETLAKEADASVATGLTRDRWLLPLFQELGYGRLPKGHAIEVEGKSFAVSHTWHQSPIHLLGAGIDLDRRQAGVTGAAMASPHGLVQEFLNRSDDHLWGFVSNGLQLRVLRDHHSLTRQAYVEFDLQAIMQGEQYSEFLLLWMVCHQSRVEAEKPEECWLETWFNTSRDEGVRALDKLRGGVEKAIEAFGTGFLADKSNAKLREALESGELDKQEYYRQVLRLVYRLIFLFVAEEREALLDPDADEAAKNRYLKYYATRRIRTLADKRRGGTHGDVWCGLRFVMAKLDDGCPDLALPALGSRLWSARACLALMSAECGNDHVLEAVRHISTIQEGRTRYPVNWRNVGADELGSIYEGLLELHPRINKEAGTFVLDMAAGHERKTTGSYYTPTELVDCLLDSALDPVLDEAAKKPNPEEAILDLKVCDPACGSGHFLVAAARRIARRLAAVRAGEDEPSPKDVQHALRDVVGRCIYGVDVNPMAVELCKVSLWMEAIEPGRPLSFLDSHIQCGNALLGATPALMARGIADDAFKPIGGDDKKVASDLKKQNKRERKAIEAGQETMFAAFEAAAVKDAETLTARTRSIEVAHDDDIRALRSKEERWENLTRSAEFKDAWFRADAWCAAFIWPKEPGELAGAAITEDRWRRIANDTTAAPALTRKTVRGLARQYRFFHWHLAFPTVFGGAKSTYSNNETTGWEGGFDLMVGNPPWERVNINQKEWFASREPRIAKARNVAGRERLIAELRASNPQLWNDWNRSSREAGAQSQLVRTAGFYPLCARGDINTYAVFAELVCSCISPRGRVGCILPSGIATDNSTRGFFADLMKRRCLVSLLEFENVGFFSAGHGHMLRFALVTVAGADSKVAATDFFFQGQDLSELSEPHRHFTLSAEDIELINPNTRTCPIFRTKRDVEIVKRVYRRIPVLVPDPDGSEGKRSETWVSGLGRTLHMGDDAPLFRTRDQLDQDGWELRGQVFCKGRSRMLPLIEAKMVYQFTHRHGDFASPGRNERVHRLPSVPVASLKDAAYVPLPYYWVPEEEIETRLTRRAWGRPWLMGWRDVTDARASVRTVIAAVFPRTATSDKLPLILPEKHPTCLLAALSSFVLDYCARQKLGGVSLNQFIFKQLPVPAPSVFDRTSTWDARSDLSSWIRVRVLELTYTAWDLSPFAQDCGYEGPPFRWDEGRRYKIRCELDAAYFHLYGVERSDIEYIMDTFPVARRYDERDHGEYRTKQQVLDVYDEMQRAIDAGEPYETLLDPPPADPRVAHPERTRPDWAPPREQLPEMPATIPTLEPQHEVPLVIWALLRARGDRIDGMDLGRAFALRSQPSILAKLVPPAFAEAASAWSDRVGQRDVTPGALAQGLSDLAERNGVQLATDGESRSVVAASEQTPANDKIDTWFRFEARLALAVLDALPPAQLTDVDGALSADDRAFLEMGSA